MIVFPSSPHPARLLLSALGLLLATLHLPAAEPTLLEPAATQDLLARLELTQSRQGPRQMSFLETRSSPLLQHPIEQQGTLAFAPPDRFRKESDISVLLSDGKHFWIVYKDLSEIEKYSLEGRSPLSRELQTILSGFRPAQLQRVFHVHAFALGEGFELVLTPRQARRSPVQEIRSRWSSDFALQSLVMQGEDGSRTEFRFSHHLPLEVTAETFAPPNAGAEEE
jgi:hypothetical protein